MINFPQEEIVKRNKLTALLTRIWELCEQMDLEDFYGKKFSTIAFMASKKLVGCNTNLDLAVTKEDHYNYAKGAYTKADVPKWQLRRDGILQQFGYNSSRFQDPLKNSDQWVVNFLFDYDGKVDSVAKKVIKDLKEYLTDKEKVKLIQTPDALTKFIQCLEDISSTKVKAEKKDKEANIELNVPVQADLPEALDWTGDIDEDPASIVSLQVFIEANHFEITGKLKNSKEEITIKEAEHYNNDKAQDLSWIDYLRVSEEPIYSSLIGLLESAIKEAEIKLETNTKKLQAILEKYGEYLVLAEM